MSNTLTALGSVAGGFGRGVLMGREDARQQKDSERRERIGGYQERQLKQAEADDVVMREAQQQASSVLQRYREQYEGPRAQALLSGQQVDGPTTFTPNQEQQLEAMQARTNYLFDKGKTDKAVQYWVNDEAFRGQLRSNAMQRGMLSYKASGDPSEVIAGVYKYMDDGWEIQQVSPQVSGEGGGITGWNVTRVDRKGNRKTDTLTPQDIDSLVQWSADPKAVAKYSLEEKLARLKAGLDVQTEGVRQQGRVALEGVKHNYSILEGKDRSKLKLGEIAAEGDQRRQTEKVKGEQDRITEGVKSKGAGAEKKDAVYDQIHDEIIRTVGENKDGPLGGTRIGNEETQAAAQYADALKRANPELSVAEAVRRSLAELKRRKGEPTPKK
jgi:hypothetical protein